MASNRKGGLDLAPGAGAPAGLSLNPKAALPLAAALSNSSQRSNSGDNHSSQGSVINGIRLNSGFARVAVLFLADSRVPR